MDPHICSKCSLPILMDGCTYPIDIVGCSCQEPSGKPRKNYDEAMAILKSMDPTKPGRCGRCQKCDSGGSCGRGGEGSSGVSLLSPSAPTPGEVEMLVRGREWDEIKGVLGTFSLNQHRVREAYEEALRHIEIAVSSLLSSHASKAREEGRKEGAEAVREEMMVILDMYVETAISMGHDPTTNLLRKLRSILERETALSQTNPKKE